MLARARARTAGSGCTWRCRRQKPLCAHVRNFERSTAPLPTSSVASATAHSARVTRMAARTGALEGDCAAGPRPRLPRRAPQWTTARPQSGRRGRRQPQPAPLRRPAVSVKGGRSRRQGGSACAERAARRPRARPTARFPFTAGTRLPRSRSSEPHHKRSTTPGTSTTIPALLDSPPARPALGADGKPPSPAALDCGAETQPPNVGLGSSGARSHASDRTDVGSPVAGSAWATCRACDERPPLPSSTVTSEREPAALVPGLALAARSLDTPASTPNGAPAAAAAATPLPPPALLRVPVRPSPSSRSTTSGSLTPLVEVAAPLASTTTSPGGGCARSTGSLAALGATRLRSADRGVPRVAGVTVVTT
jgi:hypothetical protein